MKKPLFRRLLLALTLVVAATNSARAIEAAEFVIRQDQWPKFANGSNISALPQLRQVLQQFDENGNFRIVVRYPGGDAGSAWATQLINWFVSYGVPGEFLSRELGSGGPTQLTLVLISNN